MSRTWGVIRDVLFWGAFALGCVLLLPAGLVFLVTRVFPDHRDGWVAPLSVVVYIVLVWFTLFR